MQVPALALHALDTSLPPLLAALAERALRPGKTFQLSGAGDGEVLSYSAATATLSFSHQERIKSVKLAELELKMLVLPEDQVDLALLTGSCGCAWVV
jgi:hypothetical protein